MADKLRWCGKLKIRNMEGWRGGIVYTPLTPNTVFLNSTSLIALHFANDCEFEVASERFSAFMADRLSPTEAESCFARAICVLKDANVLEEVAT
jgi:hypothetical protein